MNPFPFRFDTACNFFFELELYFSYHRPCIPNLRNCNGLSDYRLVTRASPQEFISEMSLQHVFSCHTAAEHKSPSIYSSYRGQNVCAHAYALVIVQSCLWTCLWQTMGEMHIVVVLTGAFPFWEPPSSHLFFFSSYIFYVNASRLSLSKRVFPLIPLESCCQAGYIF